MHWRIKYERARGHTHCRVFVGDSAEVTHTSAGRLYLRHYEFDDLRHRFELQPDVEFVDETPRTAEETADE